MQHVEAIATAPRPPGSAEHRRVIALVERELAGLGLRVERHETVAVSRGGGVAGRVVNLLVRLPGARGSGRAILLVTHHDGVWSGPAAGDNASGVAVVMEILRALRAGSPLDHDVIALFTDGEEAGLLGAAAFANGHPWAREVGIAINIDARGTRGRSVMFETIGAGREVMDALRRVGDIETTSLWRPVFRVAGGDTDLSELRVLDRPGLNFGFLDGFERYHTIEDDVSHLDPRSVQHHGNQVLALTRILGREPLPGAALGDATWFPMGRIGLVVYSWRWSTVLVLAAVGLALVLVVRLFRRRISALPAVIVGGIAPLGAAVAGALIGGIAVVVAPGGAGAPGMRHVYAVAIVLGAGAVAVGGWRAARRFHDAAPLQVGGIVGWACLAAVTHWRAPEASFVFSWPALLLGAAELFPVKDRPLSLPIRILGHAAALAIVVPTWYPVAMLAGVDDGGALVIGFLAPLLLWPVLATLDDSLIRRSARWTAASLAGAVGLGALVAVLRSGTEVASPLRVGYAVDVTDARAWLVTPTSSAEGWRAEVTRAAEAAPPEGAATSEPSWLGRAFPRRMSVQAKAVRPEQSPAPFVTVVRNVGVGDDREVTLRIDGLRDVLEAEVETSLPASAATIDGHRFEHRHLPADRPWSVRYVAPSDSGMTVSFTTKGAGVVEVLVRQSGLPSPLESRLSAAGGGRPIQSFTTRVQRVDLSGYPNPR
jgi:hypothetical protein